MSQKKRVDLAVIGAGPGGYIAAVEAALLGKSVVLIEKNLLGGTCLNVGCIPSKALLSSAKIFHEIKRAEIFGISTGAVSFDYRKMKERKDAVVTKMRNGLEGLLRAHKVDVIRGAAQFESPRQLKVLGENSCFVEADAIIIATGSVPLDLKAFPVDHDRILNSTSLLELTHFPKSIAIVGGGYIGCEFASLFLELGSQVTILEALDSILQLQGADIANFMTTSFQKRGVSILTKAFVQSIENKKSHVLINYNKGESLEAEYALVSVGRSPYTAGLQLEKAGLQVNAKGWIDVNERMETQVKGIYAIGDITGTALLAHVASHQGIIAAKNACGEGSSAHHAAIPAVIFTNPEIATVGLTLAEAKKANFQPISSRFPFQALGKAVAAEEAEGFVEILSDQKTGQILGATVIGAEASNLIAEMTLAIQNELTLESILDTIHAHPTLAESWHEAAGIGLGFPLNLPPKAKGR